MSIEPPGPAAVATRGERDLISRVIDSTGARPVSVVRLRMGTLLWDGTFLSFIGWVIKGIGLIESELATLAKDLDGAQPFYVEC